MISGSLEGLAGILDIISGKGIVGALARPAIEALLPFNASGSLDLLGGSSGPVGSVAGIFETVGS